MLLVLALAAFLWLAFRWAARAKPRIKAAARRAAEAARRPLRRGQARTLRFAEWAGENIGPSGASSSDGAAFSEWLASLNPSQSAAFVRAVEDFCRAQGFRLEHLMDGSLPGPVQRSLAAPVMLYALAIWTGHTRKPVPPEPAQRGTSGLAAEMYLRLADGRLVNAPAEVGLLRFVEATPIPLGALDERGQFAAALSSGPGNQMGVGEVLRRALTAWRPHAGLAALIFGTLALQQAYYTSTFLGIKVLIDGLLTGAVGVMLPTLGVLGAGLILVFFTDVGQEYLQARAASRILNDFRRRLFAQLQRLSTDYYSKAQAGNVLARFTTDMAEINRGVVAGVVDMTERGLGVLLGSLALLWLDWRLATLLVGLLLGSAWFVGKFVAPFAYRATYRLKQGEGQIAAGVEQNLRGQAVIKAFGLEAWAEEQFVGRLAMFEAPQAQALFLSRLVGITGRQILWFAELGVIGLGAALIAHGSLTVGSLAAFALLLTSVSRNLQQIVRATVPDLIVSGGGLRRIEELMAETIAPDQPPDAIRLPRIARAIELHDVSFAYPGGEDVLREVSFKIPAGAFVGIVGPSGAGKSTLLRLLMRLYDVRAGRITVDGRDLRDVTLDSLREQAGVVLQETFLFDLSARENLRIARPDATDADVEASARAAEIHERLAALPNGYDTPVGEGGSRLSAGERQRLALARALLREPSLLLLDEATSSLDAETEAAVVATLERLGHDRTIVSVTHRLASIRRADRIFVLDAGRLVESGRHDELLARRGLYHRLWHAQNSTDRSPRVLLAPAAG